MLSWITARLLYFALQQMGRRWARRTASRLDDYIFHALKGSLTRLFFLGGVYLALHRYHFARLLAIDSILFALMVVVLTHTAIRVSSAIARWMHEHPHHGPQGDRMSRDLLPLAQRVAQVVIVLVGLTVILQHFHIEVGSLLVTLGVGSLAVGLALQDTLANIIGGVILYTDRPFRLGDRVQLDTGEVGDVVDIGIRSTRLLKLDRHVVIVPNANLVRNRIVNLSLPDESNTLSVEFRVAPESDLARAKAVALEVASGVAEFQPEPAVRVAVKAYDDNGVTLVVVGRMLNFRDQMTATDTLLIGILARLRAEGIPLPTPRDVVQPTRAAAADPPTTSS